MRSAGFVRRPEKSSSSTSSMSVSRPSIAGCVVVDDQVEDRVKDRAGAVPQALRVRVERLAHARAARWPRHGAR